MSSSFITLIPKSDNPQKVADFRPISLIGVLQKLFSKLLAARLKRVIGFLISSCQSAFIANRQILDGVLAISEIVDLARKKGMIVSSSRWTLKRHMIRSTGVF